MPDGRMSQRRYASMRITMNKLFSLSCAPKLTLQTPYLLCHFLANSKQNVRGLHDLQLLDVAANHQTYSIRRKAIGEHSSLRCPRNEFFHYRGAAGEVQENHVRLDIAQANFEEPRLGEALGKQAGQAMVFAQSLELMCEPVVSGLRADPDLVETAAVPNAQATRPFDDLARTEQHRSQRGSKSLREANAHRIHFRRIVR